jgi:hypothetical protein
MWNGFVSVAPEPNDMRASVRESKSVEKPPKPEELDDTECCRKRGSCSKLLLRLVDCISRSDVSDWWLCCDDTEPCRERGAINGGIFVPSLGTADLGEDGTCLGKLNFGVGPTCFGEADGDLRGEFPCGRGELVALGGDAGVVGKISAFSVESEVERSPLCLVDLIGLGFGLYEMA